jgi:putative phosphoribosyl transferase
MNDEHAVHVTAGAVTLEGTLESSSSGGGGNATGVVLFAHGSGSSRFSTRNRRVAEVLRDGGLATLLIDLLTPAEEEVDLRTRHIRFDIPLLAERLVGAIDWLERNDATAELPVGLFGASTGGGAALVAAAQRPERVQAVVSRGGRPDLADGALASVRAPTLLIVGGNDEQVIELNVAAAERMLDVGPAVAPTERLRADAHPEVRIEIIPGATHLFQEPGALEQVAVLARDWFIRHLGAAAISRR